MSSRQTEKHETRMWSKSSWLPYNASKTKSLKSKREGTTPNVSCSSSHFGDEEESLAITGQQAPITSFKRNERSKERCWFNGLDDIHGITLFHIPPYHYSWWPNPNPNPKPRPWHISCRQSSYFSRTLLLIRQKQHFTKLSFVQPNI